MNLLKEHFGIRDFQKRKSCCERILDISASEAIEETLQHILNAVVTDDRQKTLKYQLKDWINKEGYANRNNTYWQDTRNLFVEIIFHNICKASLILYGNYDIAPEQYREKFESLDLVGILEKQNEFSSMRNGYIWVLNTCVFIIADYNFSLVQEMRNDRLTFGRSS